MGFSVYYPIANGGWSHFRLIGRILAIPSVSTWKMGAEGALHERNAAVWALEPIVDLVTISNLNGSAGGNEIWR